MNSDTAIKIYQVQTFRIYRVFSSSGLSSILVAVWKVFVFNFYSRSLRSHFVGVPDRKGAGTVFAQDIKIEHLFIYFEC